MDYLSVGFHSCHWYKSLSQTTREYSIHGLGTTGVSRQVPVPWPRQDSTQDSNSIIKHTITKLTPHFHHVALQLFIVARANSSARLPVSLQNEKVNVSWLMLPHSLSPSHCPNHCALKMGGLHLKKPEK